MSLQTLGWNPFFSDAFKQLALEHTVPARVVRQDKNRYRIHEGEALRFAVLPGKHLHNPESAPRPAVGDWVAIEVKPGDTLAVIQAVLPRRSSFSRKEAGSLTREQVVAANIDTIFLVTGLDGDYNLRRIERYVTQAWNSGATPVIVLNKADVCPNLDEKIAEVEEVAMGVEIHAVSAKEGLGLDPLEAYVGSGKTVAFLGSSGVGKSTLVNHLMGQDEVKTGEVRQDDSRGRHTTSYRELLLLPSGGAVIDTPGLRELQLWGSEEDLEGSFSDVEELAEACRFRDCTHETEPGCAVQAAIEEGTLDLGRYQSYLKLRRELDYLARRQDESAAYIERQRWKKMTKMYKSIIRDNPKRR